MKRIFLCMGLILLCFFTLGVGEREESSDACGNVCAEYTLDPDSGIIAVSLLYSGDEISALGVVCNYDLAFMDYTGYERGVDAYDVELSSTLENNGRVRVLAYSPDQAFSGEIVRLYFKMRENAINGSTINLAPLTSIPCAKIEGGEIIPVSVSFSSLRIHSYMNFPLDFCGITPAGELLFLTDVGEVLCRVSVVDLDGGVYGYDVLCRSRKIRFPDNEALFICLKLNGRLSPHTAVIIDAYAINNEKLCYQRSVLLFYYGELLE